MRPIRKGKNALIFGPWVGELGWELTEWLPRLFAMSRKFEKVVAISYESSRSLYNGYDFFAHNYSLQDSHFAFGKINRSDELQIIVEAAKKFHLNDFTVYTPYNKSRLANIVRRALARKEYRSMCNSVGGLAQCDIVVHFRNFVRRGDSDDKNFPTATADDVCGKLRDFGFTVVAIGHPEMSYAPAGAIDGRSADIDRAVEFICGSKIVVGGSSAPMHLAQLCKKPIVTFFSPPSVLARYQGYWNPFNADLEVVTDSSFQPNSEQVVDSIFRLYERLK